jgi:cytochrome c-type protein NapB
MEINRPPSESHSADHLLPLPLRRFIPVIATTGITLAVVGLVSGIREPDPVVHTPRLLKAVEGKALQAVDYADLPSAPWRREIPVSSLESLQSPRPGIYEIVVRTDEMKQATLADRAHRRAFDGAPPIIPHRVDSTSAAACLVCHRDGLNIGGRIATKICHPPFSNCLQCHVEQLDQSPSLVSYNSFTGLARSGPGERASPGAPPTIPHTIFLREDCLSCHGWAARPGIRTTHPWLSTCVQCHVTSTRNHPNDYLRQQ